jgi:AcrR family transcriptional regulator
VFLERGFHAASLDAIAEEAGFSKGVVYSQFESKADLFLALLEQRIDERAAENERVAEHGSGPAALAELVMVAERSAAAESAWQLLLLEFRVHAARDRALNERYAELHARTVQRLAATLVRITGGGARPSPPAEARALFMLALGAGLALEAAAAPHGLPDAELRAMAVRTLDPGTGGAVTRRRTKPGRRAAAPRVRPRRTS